MRPPTLLAIALALAPILRASPVGAQQPGACGADTALNVYRYVLDVEPPESPALAVLEATTSHSRGATAPKPLAVSVVSLARGGERGLVAGAVDVAPYWLVGGGGRTLCGYRDNSVAGRLKRVGTKTVVSLGVQPLPGSADAVRFAAAVRATAHDPHDPINNSALVAQLRAAGAGDELEPWADSGGAAYEAARRAMRARDRWIVSGGWGVAATLEGGSFGRVEGAWRHVVWLSWQRTLDARFDLLFTGEAGLERGAGPGYRATAAARRKQAHADLLLEMAFDTRDERVHPGLSAEARVAPRLRAALGVLTGPAKTAGGGGRVLRAAASLRWSAGY